jgi:hypothetical protein
MNYLLEEGWYLTSTPEFTSNWENSSNDRWTTPLGGGFGRVVELGAQPINLSLQGFWNIDSPDNVGADWAVVFNIELLYTKRGFRSWVKKAAPN